MSAPASWPDLVDSATGTFFAARLPNGFLLQGGSCRLSGAALRPTAVYAIGFYAEPLNTVARLLAVNKGFLGASNSDLLKDPYMYKALVSGGFPCSFLLVVARAVTPGETAALFRRDLATCGVPDPVLLPFLEALSQSPLLPGHRVLLSMDGQALVRLEVDASPGDGGSRSGAAPAYRSSVFTSVELSRAIRALFLDGDAPSAAALAPVPLVDAAALTLPSAVPTTAEGLTAALSPASPAALRVVLTHRVRWALQFVHTKALRRGSTPASRASIRTAHSGAATPPVGPAAATAPRAPGLPVPSAEASRLRTGPLASVPAPVTPQGRGRPSQYYGAAHGGNNDGDDDGDDDGVASVVSRGTVGSHFSQFNTDGADGRRARASISHASRSGAEPSRTHSRAHPASAAPSAALLRRPVSLTTKTGYLHKYSFGLMGDKWRPRFFQLSGCLLAYRLRPEDELRGCVDLAFCTLHVERARRQPSASEPALPGAHSDGDEGADASEPPAHPHSAHVVFSISSRKTTNVYRLSAEPAVARLWLRALYITILAARHEAAALRSLAPACAISTPVHALGGRASELPRDVAALVGNDALSDEDDEDSGRSGGRLGRDLSFSSDIPDFEGPDDYIVVGTPLPAADNAAVPEQVPAPTPVKAVAPAAPEAVCARPPSARELQLSHSALAKRVEAALERAIDDGDAHDAAASTCGRRLCSREYIFAFALIAAEVVLLYLLLPTAGAGAGGRRADGSIRDSLTVSDAFGEAVDALRGLLFAAMGAPAHAALNAAEPE
jgi:hypothetical protein